MPVLGWWFSAAPALPNDDARPVVLGETLSVKGAIVPCKHGLHASVSAYDALQYAPGPLLWRVELSGTVVPHGEPIDKYAASRRKTLAGGVDCMPILRAFARQCALDVIHLWDAPQIVREYLETGNEDLRAAAWAAAWDAARAVAAARDAARDAAVAAATDAARDAQRAHFEALCLEFIEEVPR